MRKIYFIQLTACFFLIMQACVSDEQKKAQNDSKSVDSGNVKSPKKALLANCIEQGVFFDDSIIDVLRLLSNSNLKRSNIGQYINEWDTAHSDLYMVNSTKAEYLKLTMLPGFGDGEYGYVEVGKVNEKTNKLKTVNSEQRFFMSRMGIRLGLKYKEVIEILKTNRIDKYAKKDSDTIVLNVFYKDRLCFLENYGMPLYESKFFFKKGKLVLFGFGFENP